MVLPCVMTLKRDRAHQDRSLSSAPGGFSRDLEVDPKPAFGMDTHNLSVYREWPCQHVRELVRHHPGLSGSHGNGINKTDG